PGSILGAVAGEVVHRELLRTVVHVGAHGLRVAVARALAGCTGHLHGDVGGDAPAVAATDHARGADRLLQTVEGWIPVHELRCWNVHDLHVDLAASGARHA